MALATLVEGKDYFIDKNGKAHFKDMTYGPVPPVDSQSGAKGNGIQGSAKATSMMGYLNKVAGEDAKDWGSGTGTQCVELPKHYIETVWGFKTKEMGLGNGKDMYYMIPNAFPDTFEKIDYSDNFVPQVGDIISLRGSDKNKTLYGHAAIVTSVSGNEVTIVDQWEDYDGDASNNKVREITFTITGNIASANSDSFYDIYGVARPK
jgi:surface antigen